MRNFRLFAILLSALFFLLPSLANAQAPFNSMKLLTDNTGWVAINNHLYWTTDFGHDWTDITPPGVGPSSSKTIAEVFFLDPSTGWALLRKPGPSKYGDWSFELASTNNGGASWLTTPVSLPNWHAWEDFVGGSIYFMNPTRGWLGVALESNSGVARGLVYSTSDGGDTWQFVPGAPMISANIHFVTPKLGWIAGGPGGTDLYRTDDGGKTWTRATVPRPTGVRPNLFTSYGMPTFSDPLHGSLAAIYADADIAMFITSDGGRTWAQAIPMRPVSNQEVGSATLLGSTLLTASVSSRGSVTLSFQKAGGHKRTALGSIPPTRGAVVSLSFRSPETGWAFTGDLFATTDGGQTWTNITPPLLARHKPSRVGAAPVPAPATRHVGSYETFLKEKVSGRGSTHSSAARMRPAAQ